LPKLVLEPHLEGYDLEGYCILALGFDDPRFHVANTLPKIIKIGNSRLPVMSAHRHNPLGVFGRKSTQDGRGLERLMTAIN